MDMMMDRSKYRNPDMPIGYIRKNPRLEYKIGIEIDGIHYIWAPYLHEADVENREDYATLSDLITSGEEDVVKDNEGDLEQNPGTNQSSLDTSALDTSLSLMDIASDKRQKKKKSKKSKKGRKNYHRSSSSDSFKRNPTTSRRHCNPSSSYKHRSPPSDRRKKIVTYSPSPSPEPEEWKDVKIKQELDVKIKQELDVKIKQEPDVKIKQELMEPEHLFGSYICEVCNITMNSELTYLTHINGKRHRKNLKLKNVSKTVAENIPSTVVSEDQTKYPKPAAGVVRKKVNRTAAIQQVLEKEINRPCPGLNHVTEIQGIAGTQYYCSMCDCVCSASSIIAHLTGYKHQLSSVKVFKPGTYESIQFEPKYKIERQIMGILKAVQIKDGMGRVAVEVEELASNSTEDDYKLSQSSTSRDTTNQPSTSRDTTSQPSTSRGKVHRHSDMPLPDKFHEASVPCADSSDFFCKTCDSHMNSVGMWESHIRGKRHLKNVNKMDHEVPSKSKTVKLNKRAYIIERLQRECPHEPIIGLQEIRETEVVETNSHTYQCFLCGSCHTSLDIVDHLISFKHRTKYLDYINFHGREVIYGMNEIMALPLVKQMCAQEQAKSGTGQPQVYGRKSLF